MRNLKTIWLILLLFVGGTLSAQRVVERDDEGKVIKVTRVVPKWDKKHDLRLGVGSYSLAATLFLDGISFVSTDGISDLPEQILNATTRRTPQRYWGGYSFSYAYHSRRWFEVGGTLTYCVASQSRRDLETNKVVKNMDRHALSIMPTCRFNYFYREKVQLYSAISGGVVIGTGFTFPWLDATLFGCSFGKKFFGFAEIGAGIGGWGRAGIGYRFDAKKK